MILRSCCLTLAILFGCGDSAEPRPDASDATLDASDGGAIDSGADSGPPSDGAVDTTTDTATDATSPAAFGEILSECGLVMVELGEATPSFFQARLDFETDPFDDPEDLPRLTDDAREVFDDGNEGGSSLVSEVFAMEVLARCEGARLVKTETEIDYEPETSKKTDLLVQFSGTRIGVSVTRAQSFPLDAPYREENAQVLERKLDSILESSENVVEADSWDKQILVVLAYGDMHADVIRTVWDGLDAETRADTIVYVIVTDGMDAPIYTE